MKKILILFSILLVFCTLGCKDWLDIKPESETVLEDYWQTESQATSVLAGCYRGLIRDDAIARMMVWGELRSDNIVMGNSIAGDMYRILTVNITPTNSYADWSKFYEVINYCNTFLHYAPSVVNKDQNFTETKLHTLEAEAYALRALSYFYLVRAFRDVPLTTEPSISDDQVYDIPKSSDSVVIKQIIKDLQYARLYAKTDYENALYDKGRITLRAVNSILADVYLLDQQYDNCISMCNEILNDNTLKMVTGANLLTDVFYTGNSTESIFELQFDKDVQYNNLVKNMYGVEGARTGNWSYAYYLGPNGTSSPFNYLPSTLNESANDLREKNFFGTATNGDGYCIYKYALIKCIENTDETVTPIYRTTSTTPNWIVYRLPDIILMKAEALVQLDRDDNDLKEALNLVNMTYMRSNLTADSLKFENYPDKNSMSELVLRERQRELLFEGKRWFDLMRVVRRSNDATSILKYISPKLTGDNMQVKKMSVIDGLYMPILQSQIDINPLLIQNPFYEDTDVSTSN